MGQLSDFPYMCVYILLLNSVLYNDGVVCIVLLVGSLVVCEKK